MDNTINRRDFIKATTATTAGVATLGAGITLTTYVNANENPVTNEKRWGMLVDTNQLTESDIDGMVSACQKEHGWGDEIHSTGDQKAGWIKKVKVKDTATQRISNLALMCQHCDEPPVVEKSTVRFRQPADMPKEKVRAYALSYEWPGWVRPIEIDSTGKDVTIDVPPFRYWAIVLLQYPIKP